MGKDSSTSRRKYIGVAIIRNNQEQVLIDKRRQDGLMGGLWEFPGGKVEAGETVEECIKREIFEELGIEVQVGSCLITLDYSYTHYPVTLIVHHCTIIKGVPQPLACEKIRWVSLDELDEYPFLEANDRIIATLRQNANGDKLAR
jgi:8-oxo-dGTP diphosphatase